MGCPTAIAFGAKSTGNRVQNNVFVDCGRGFIAWPAEATPQKELDHNIYFSTKGSPKWEVAGKTYTSFGEYQKAAGEGRSRYEDPRLVGPADARLRAGSPAIDAGAVLKVGQGPAAKEIATDAGGTPRLQGGAPDISAYEFKAAGPK